jgi:cytochrome oxidase assembly protein ShyY1
VGSNASGRTALQLPTTADYPKIFVGRTKPADTFLKSIPKDFEVIPLVLVATNAWPGLTPSLQPGLEAIPNNHLSYALTWFCLALTLLGVYCAYVYQLRKRY